ncbi:MAG: hypothetical protein EZS28_020144 [Streblomastix strix]|uniref:Uncharacterized protein n=1 Tax=Streblomastix strix TaxID=222440 RepID=A0A5J4VP81_9EUKA|nr:MAG: hypothetical protein EZS28_020144 [Streblomastix strix]
MVSQIGKENDAGWALGAALCEAQMIRHSLTHQQKRKSLQSQNQIENQGQDIDDEEDEERRRIESKYELTYDQIRQSKISFNFTLHPIFPQNTTTDFDTSEEPDEKLKDSKSWIGDYFADPPVPIQLEVEQGTYFVLNRGSEWNEMREIYIRGCLILLIMFITLQLVSFYTSQNPPRNYKDQNM